MNKVEFSRAAKVPFAKRYDNFIGGKWAAPHSGKYFENISPVTGRPLCEIARSDAADIEAALDAAHKAKGAWGKTDPATRALILHRIADRMEENLDLLALAETWDNGKPIRETTAADLPLAVDHFRYFAGVLRAQEGTLSEIDHDTVAYHFHEPLGVVGQIIPWNFPLLMAVWKLAPALAAGNCVVLKPAEQTPASIMLWADLIGDLLPEGVLNIVNGFGLEAGKPLASSNRIAQSKPASRFDEYVTCPLMHFFKRNLRLAPFDEVERDVTPLERGDVADVFARAAGVEREVFVAVRAAKNGRDIICAGAGLKVPEQGSVRRVVGLKFAAVATNENDVAGRYGRSGITGVRKMLRPNDLARQHVDRAEHARAVEPAADSPQRADIVPRRFTGLEHRCRLRIRGHAREAVLRADVKHVRARTVARWRPVRAAGRTGCHHRHRVPVRRVHLL